ncbi:hypothetical protein GXP67_02785 [Rhodocytophaga rosea]|uniref:Uncharacterized protein n=1 Tax=Rhodocytophaga rosea TaxID=2704465 RepID=A0A6C0GCI1_9BACT|nr:hypothetical protein [Rhodocytophaga rosea]QHT65666.1 hypothetical protein GXP67_02785 [Rhodocytophaga rosea]
MNYAMYFERSNREHITLDEWLKAIESIPELQLAGITNNNFEDWIGYFKHADDSKQFHHREDRKYDAEIYSNKETKWKRVFYWGFSKSKKWGVIRFEANDDPSNPVNVVADKIADLLGARIRGEDYTWYED